MRLSLRQSYYSQELSKDRQRVEAQSRQLEDEIQRLAGQAARSR
jgi:hypothetical protein